MLQWASIFATYIILDAIEKWSQQKLIFSRNKNGFTFNFWLNLLKVYTMASTSLLFSYRKQRKKKLSNLSERKSKFYCLIFAWNDFLNNLIIGPTLKFKQTQKKNCRMIEPNRLNLFEIDAFAWRKFICNFSSINFIYNDHKIWLPPVSSHNHKWIHVCNENSIQFYDISINLDFWNSAQIVSVMPSSNGTHTCLTITLPSSLY